MHDIKWIRDNATAFDAALKRRGLEPLSPSLLAIDERRRAAILKSEQAQARRNSASREIGDAKKAKDDARASALMAEVAELKTTMPQLEQEAKAADEELAIALAAIPNLPAEDVPEGTDEHGNVQRHLFGAVRNYAFAPKPHDDIGVALGTMDFETAAKLSGARFVVLKKGLARLERAIGQFMLDLHTNEHGYTEINPPLLVRDDVMFGTGQLPKFKDDQFGAATSKKIDLRQLVGSKVNSEIMLDLFSAYMGGDVDAMDEALARLQHLPHYKEIEAAFSRTFGSSRPPKSR